MWAPDSDSPQRTERACGTRPDPTSRHPADDTGDRMRGAAPERRARGLGPPASVGAWGLYLLNRKPRGKGPPMYSSLTPAIRCRDGYYYLLNYINYLINWFYKEGQQTKVPPAPCAEASAPAGPPSLATSSAGALFAPRTVRVAREGGTAGVRSVPRSQTPSRCRTGTRGSRPSRPAWRRGSPPRGRRRGSTPRGPPPGTPRGSCRR